MDVTAKSAPKPHEEAHQASTPLRFMQIHPFYPQYLASLYGQHQHLAQADFATQMKVLEQDGFSAVHMIGFYLSSLGYETQVVTGNNIPSQHAWAFESGFAHSLRRVPSLQEIAVAQVDAFQPDILYLSDPITFDSSFIRLLPRRPRLILGWRAANVPEDWDASEFDVMLSCLSGIRRKAMEQGAREVVHFYPGFPEHLFHGVPHVEPSYDVCFSGQVNGNQYPLRIRLLHTLTEACLQGQHSLRMHLSGRVESATPLTRAVNQGPVFGMSMYAALRSCRIVFDVRGSIGATGRQTGSLDLAGRETANMRLFEATGMGSCLLTQEYDNLVELFEPEKEIVTYTSEKDMVDKLRYYLTHEQDRLAIAEAGRSRCHRDHSMAKRLLEFDAIIRSRLSERADPLTGDAMSGGCSGGSIETGARAQLVSDPIQQIIRSISRLSANDTEHGPAIREMLRQATEVAQALLDADDPRQAMRLATAVKALQVEMVGLDMLRARIFLALNQTDLAREALVEELRLAPDNAFAQALLEQITYSATENPTSAQAHNGPSHTPRLSTPSMQLQFESLRQALGNDRFTQRRISFLGYDLTIVDGRSVVYQFKDIFVDQIYRFDAGTPAPRILDCGANVGLSCLYFKRLYPQAKIVAFEADRKIVRHLEANLAKNGAADVRVLHKACWVHDQGVHFAADGADGGHIAQAGGHPEQAAIPSVRLRDVIARMPSVSLLKMDIEGAETEVLLDCRDVLSRVEHLFFEFHSREREPQRLGELLTLLQDVGYRYCIQDIAPRPSPFINRTLYAGFDMQLNVFAYR